MLPNEVSVPQLAETWRGSDPLACDVSIGQIVKKETNYNSNKF